MADLYMPIRGGMPAGLRLLLTHDAIHHEYVLAYTNASFLVKDGFGFEDGLFTGYDPEKRDYDKSSWDYQFGADGFVLVDETLQHPRCVYQLMKQHYSRYTPEMVSRITGTPQDKFLQACAWIAETAAPDKAMTSMYALGWTQHSKGSQNIRTMAMIQLLLGNIGVAGGGMNALRGHSNIQGLTDLGLMSNLIPGYMDLPVDREQDRATYLSTRKFTPLRPNQISYFQNYGKFFTSFQKAMYGRAATAENDYGYDWLPKLDKVYDVLRVFDLMHQGKMTGYFCQGFNPLMAFPNKAKVRSALSQLKFLVVMDPLATETASFWENHGEYNDSNPAEIKTEVFRLPTSCFAEESGSLTNSGRWLQWHWKAAEPPGEALTDVEILTKLFRELQALYRAEGGAAPEPIFNLHWPYVDPEEPTTEEIAKEINGSVVEDVRRRAGSDEDRVEGGPAGRRLRPAARRRQDRLRMLDLLRLLHQRRQPDGAARHRRSGTCRARPRLGLGLAGQPPHPLQPRILRHAGPTLQPEARVDRVERHPVERHRRPGLPGDVPALGGSRALHHERRRAFRGSLPAA